MGRVGFFFDENLPAAIARALMAIGVTCRNTKDENLESTKDIELFDFCRRERLVLVTKDRKILKNAIERGALVDSGITVINIDAPNLTLRSLFRLVVKNLEKMEKTLGDTHPCVYNMAPRSFRTIDEALARRKRH